ncbi:hypothetical protein G7Y79_00008g023510 [Physcia stellaris]|nr:hypothetical protein G7Y79_00008g023510 [Physcia stellaris]
MYGSAETSRPLKLLTEVRRQPAESISYLSGTAVPRRNTLTANAGEPSASYGVDPTDKSVGPKRTENTESRSTQGQRARTLRLERHSSQDLRKECNESDPSRQTSHRDAHKRIESRTEIEVLDTKNSYQRSKESGQGQVNPRARHDTLPQPVRKLAQAVGSSFAKPTIEVDINPWDEELPASASNVMSATEELYHNPFAESKLSRSWVQPPREARHGGKRSSSQERPAHFDDQQPLPKETGPPRPRRKPILKPSRSRESLDQRKVRFGADTQIDEDMGPDLSHRPATHDS